MTPFLIDLFKFPGPLLTKQNVFQERTRSLMRVSTLLQQGATLGKIYSKSLFLSATSAITIACPAVLQDLSEKDTLLISHTED